jgi:hypothetical protein
MGKILKLVEKDELTRDDLIRNRFEALENLLMTTNDDYLDELIDLCMRYTEEFDYHRELEMCHVAMLVAWGHLQKWREITG